MTGDVIVYAHPDGKTYVAVFEDQWVRWPAVAQGWRSRQICPETLAESCEELSPRLGHIALLLSGVEL